MSACPRSSDLMCLFLNGLSEASFRYPFSQSHIGAALQHQADHLAINRAFGAKTAIMSKCTWLAKLFLKSILFDYRLEFSEPFH